MGVNTDGVSVNWLQFGSRIARESNVREFGSNRAANQAAAGGLTVGSLREGQVERC